MSQVAVSTTNPLKHSRFSEYLILYSTNLVQKSKVWHDGKCKFFEFNKKLIIYNEDNIVISTNFLGNPKLLELRNKEILLNDSILITIEEKLGEYERDVSNLFKNNGKTREEKVIDHRIYQYTPEKENVIAKTPFKKTRRIGLSKLYSPSHISRVKSLTPIKQTVPKSKSVTRQDGISQNQYHSPEIQENDRMNDITSHVSPFRASKATNLRTLLLEENISTTRRSSSIDVYASGDEEDISEELSDVELDFEEDVSTQTRTYNYTKS